MILYLSTLGAYRSCISVVMAEGENWETIPVKVELGPYLEVKILLY